MEDLILKMIDRLGDNDARFARKAINYYDGRQTEELIKTLSDSSSFRKHWREKGMIVRTRNITKAIVDKSGLLFNGNQPKLEVWENNVINQNASEAVLDLFDKAEWIEFFSNFDNLVRILKTGLVLVQRTSEGKLFFDALHRGNSVVSVDPNTREVKELLFYLGENSYRHFTTELVTDYIYNSDAKQLIVESQIENFYGIVPVAAFHDTAIPRTGIWNVAPTDIIGLNEAYNLHLMESEYSAAWSKVKTLFTNASIDADSNRVEYVMNGDSPFPIQQPSSTPAAVGGPGRIVQIETMGGQQPYVEYKGPDINLDPIETMFADWVKGFAADWSVRLNGAGNATSGFQLIVEEMPNLELRKARQKMFQSGFARLYKVLTYVMQGVPGFPILPNAKLYVDFGDPSLPIDEKAQEEVWSRRITEGRASRVDYFMEVNGMSRDEAVKKVAEIDAFNRVTPPASTRNTVVQIT